MGWQWLRRPPAQRETRERDPQRATSDEGFAFGQRIVDALGKHGDISIRQYEQDADGAAAETASGTEPGRAEVRRDPAVSGIRAARVREADREAGG
jgi:hypothetical protein